MAKKEDHEYNTFELGALAEAIQSGDPMTQLIGMRDFVVQELEGNRCNTCMMSKLRTGDTAALVTKLQQIVAEIKLLPVGDGKVTKLEELRRKRAAIGSTDPGVSASPDPREQRRTGSRRPGAGGGSRT